MCKNVRFLYVDIMAALFAALFLQCRQEMPITASIVIDAEAKTEIVERNLYGVSLEEINHAIEGGIYAELIQNRSFEDGVTPVNCRFDAVTKQLITPNGGVIPFCGEDSIVGWYACSSGTQLLLDRKEVINEKNKRSLYVGVYETETKGRGGVIAEGYKGIAIRKGEKYALSLFLKAANALRGTINIALESADLKQPLSDVYRTNPLTEWQRVQHTFTATADARHAVLTITTDSTAQFQLDVVSLFPEKTWMGRKSGFRADVMEAIAALKPHFVRFPGGEFVEGYAAGTYPEWKATIGDISERTHFWSVAGYGTSMGAGYHEYLQLCEDLKAEPVYVINSGITSQNHRPRYEELKTMNVLVQNAIDALAYANAPADSIWGAARARNGHPAPFNLKYIQIGNENRGSEYALRYALFKKAIQEYDPSVTVIASDYQPQYPENRTDHHFYASETFLMAHHNYFETGLYTHKLPPVSIGAFSATDKDRGTLGKAVSEACFLIGMERNPDVVKQIAYAPLLANMDYTGTQLAAINFTNHQVLKTPSYYLLNLFAGNRGEEVLKTDVTSYQKPQVTVGTAGVYLFDDGYDITNVSLDAKSDYKTCVKEGAWTAAQGILTPAANRWNYILLGDSAAYNYEFTARIRRTKGSGPIQFNMRDNGYLNEKKNHVSFTLGTTESTISHHTGKTTLLLSHKPVESFINNTWYDVKVVCKDEAITCYVNDSLIHDIKMAPIPSLVSVATWDKTNGMIILKVVNTTFRVERTQLDIKGISVDSEVQLIQLAGEVDSYNTLLHPNTIEPVNKTITLSGSPLMYSFPPNSITLMLLKTD